MREARMSRLLGGGLLSLGSTWLLCLLIAPLAQAAWLPPVSISASGESVGTPHVVLDSEGNATAVWDRWDGNDTVVESAYRPAGEGWQTPIDLSEAGEIQGSGAEGETDASSPRIAVDAHGDATVVWERYAGTNRILIQADYRPAGGDWQAPVDIGEVHTEMAPEPWIAVDSNGDATAVWNNEGIMQSAYRPVDGNWEAPVAISDPEAFAPQAAVDAQGDATAVWMYFDGSRYVVQGAYRPAGGSWETPTDLSEPGEVGGDPHIALDASGDALVVWRGESDGEEVARAAFRPAGGSWEAPTNVSAVGEEVHELRVTLDARGDAIAAWAGSTHEVGAHSIVQAAFRRAGGSWEAPTALSEGGENANPSDVVFDQVGNAALLWERSDGTNNVVQAAYRPEGGSWEAPVDLSNSGENATDAEVVLDAPGDASAADGDATAVWVSGGCEGKSTCTGTVQAVGYDSVRPPSEVIEVPATGMVGEPIEVSVPPEDIWSPKIEFGDGTSATSTSATHSYSQPGRFAVKFTSTDVLGYQSTAQRTIAISSGDGPPASGSSAEHVVVSLQPSSIIANGSSTTVASAEVTDASAKPASGQSIAFSSTDPGEKIGPVSELSEGNYAAKITSSTTVGAPTITATDSSVAPTVSGTETLNQTGTPTSAAVYLSPSTITADGASTTKAIAIVTDADGDPVSDQNIAFSSTDVGERIGSTAESITGTYTATITSSTKVGSPTITATDSSASPSISASAVLSQKAKSETTNEPSHLVHACLLSTIDSADCGPPSLGLELGGSVVPRLLPAHAMAPITVEIAGQLWARGCPRFAAS